MPLPIDRPRLARALVALLLLLSLAGCTGIAATAPPPGATVEPGPPMTEGEARLFLIGKLGPPWYCDPDAFPVARDEQQSAIERYAEVVAEAGLFAALAASLNIGLVGPHTAAEKLALYRAWKPARAIALERIGANRFRFDYLVQPVAGQEQGLHVTGVIDDQGAFTVEQQEPSGEPICPICLDRMTTIDTPLGPVPVDRLRLGDLVWTLDANGRRVPGSVIALGSVPAPAGHQVVRLRLADGRSLSASPGHLLADGRIVGDLRLGDVLDDSVVSNVERIPYAGGETFDLAVSGATGIYLAGGIPLGSTLD